ncbi:MAG: hypothetical protein ACOX25_09705 [Caldicoprobacterales bacterium]
MSETDRKNKTCIPKQSTAQYAEAVMERTLSALRTIRLGVSTDEFQIQSAIERALCERGIPFKKEYRLAPRNRIDFYIEGGIGLEVKRGKPNAAQVTKQLKRYAAFEEIKAMILVVDKTLSIPDSISGKRCILFGLNRLWGVALS